MNAGFNINDLVQDAQNRWLKPAEVLFILQNHQNYDLTEAPPQKPISGSLLLYNKKVTRSFRNDGHSWRTKRASKSVREGHERLKVGDVEALNCYYAHGEQNHYFQRRSFWMLDPAYAHIVLVHYRDITKKCVRSVGCTVGPKFAIICEKPIRSPRDIVIDICISAMTSTA